MANQSDNLRMLDAFLDDNPSLVKDSIDLILVDQLNPSAFQPRKFFDPGSHRELVLSIKEQGVIQPLLIREVEKNQYEIIAGERRWRAAKEAGLKEIPAIIKKISDETALAIALIENIQRENLNPIEEAVAYNRLLTECKLTHEEVAQKIGKPRSSVSNLLRLLDLEPEVRELVMKHKISIGHAKVLLPLERDLQIEAAFKIENSQLSVRQTEDLIKNLPFQTAQKINNMKKNDIIHRHIEKRFESAINSQVKIKVNQAGKGRVIIFCDSFQDIERLLKLYEHKN